MKKLICACLGLVFLSAGCGGGSSDRPAVATVSGSVKYKGNPVKDALVTFRTEKSPRAATGTTNEKGEFSLTTFDTNDGATIGEHIVTIQKLSAAAAQSGAGGTGTTSMSPADYMKAMQASKTAAPPGSGETNKELPGKYADPKTSGLKRTVVKGEKNVFNIDLTE